MDHPLINPKIEIHYEDNKLTLSRIADGSVSLLLQDPPFEVTQNEWDIKPDLPVMWKHWERVCKEDAAMIFFATQPFACDLIDSNRKLFRYDMIWYKALGTGHLNANKMPMRNHEHLLVFYKKLPTYNPQMGVGIRKKGKRDNKRNGTNYGTFANEDLVAFFDDEGKRFPQSVVDFTNGDRTSESDHPTQKPLDLIRYLVRTYSNEGDLVYDGYSGSGTTAIACLQENRDCITSEDKKVYFDQSIIRLEEARKKPELNLDWGIE